MSDSATREEINHINAKPVMSDFEKETEKEIIAWCEKNDVVYYNSPRQAIKQYWEEKLC